MPWFVIYTKSRNEKKVAELLQKNGVEVFCPLVKLKKNWSDRKKIVERLKKGPSYIKQYIKKLPHIEMQDDQGNIQIATKIPQTIYQYLFGNF